MWQALLPFFVLFVALLMWQFLLPFSFFYCFGYLVCDFCAFGDYCQGWVAWSCILVLLPMAVKFRMVLYSTSICLFIIGLLVRCHCRLMFLFPQLGSLFGWLHIYSLVYCVAEFDMELARRQVWFITHFSFYFILYEIKLLISMMFHSFVEDFNHVLILFFSLFLSPSL